jgi:hypothetical protein
MIISILNTIVTSLKSGTDTFAFGYGPEYFANIELDEATFPVIYLDQPVPNDYLLTAGGYIGETYPINLIFMYKSEMDDTPAQLETKCINPANLAIRQFISACQSSTLIDEISNTTGLEFTHLPGLDVGVSGKTLTITIKPNINASVCIQE